jgi:hypothetical protein
MPVRLRIHSSEVANMPAIASFVRMSGGTQDPIPQRIAALPGMLILIDPFVRMEVRQPKTADEML